jgi:dihydroorotate dehydrogenase (fumarate)
MANIKTTLCGIELDSPFVLGSGPCGWDAEALAACVKAGCGAVVTKSISTLGDTNTTRHMVSGGNMCLLNNEGGSDMPVGWWIGPDGQIAKAKALGVKCLIASVRGYEGIEEAITIAKAVEESGADIIEFVNGYSEPGDIAEQLAAIKKVVNIPLIAKVNGNWKNTEEVAKACEAAGADAITAIDSIGPTYHVDIATGRPILGGKGYGYMTGANILPIALRFIHDISGFTTKDLIGMGGVTNAEAALEMLMAGSTCVGVCTAAIVKGPEVFKELTENLSKLMDKYGYPDIASVSKLTHRTEKLEEISPADFVYDSKKCNHCGRCVKACAYRARSFDEKGSMAVNPDQCRVCGLCFGMCAKKAISIK